jgi:small subunit ribosomal protein S1
MSEILNETSIADEIKKVDTKVETTTENIPSMKDFEDEINRSFHKIEDGSLLKGTVIGITDTKVILDLGSYSEGIIPIEELSHDPRFSIKTDVVIGEEISGVVLREDREGNIILSKKQADTLLSFDILKRYMENKTIKRVKISDVVNGGVITYLEGIRAFIPASQITLSYTENLSEFLHKEIDVMVITVDEEKEKLVLSGKEVERKIAAEDKNKRVSRLQIGLVTTGIVDKIVPYGAFIDMGEGLSGLVHISQICGKRIKSPNEVLKEGMEVNVKITDIKDGKISLSIKAVTEDDEVAKEGEDVPFEYSSGGDISTGLGSLLSKIKL